MTLQNYNYTESSSFLSFSMEQKHDCHPLNNYWETSTHLISGICVAYYKFPTGWRINGTADVLTSHHSRTSSVPHVSSSLATWYIQIHLGTTAKRSGSVWPPYPGTGTTDQADLVKLGSTQLNLMLLHSTLVWRLPTIEQNIDRHGGRSWKRKHPLDKPHDDDDDSLMIELIFVFCLVFTSRSFRSMRLLYRADRFCCQLFLCQRL